MLAFDGSTSRVVADYALSLPKLSIVARIRPSGTGGAQQGVIVSHYTAVASHFSWRFPGGGALGLRFFVVRSGGSGTFDSPVLTLGREYVVGMSYDGASVANVPAVYYDGSPVSVTVVAAGSGTWDNDGGSLYVGTDQGGSRTWAGALGAVAVWPNLLLTAEEHAYIARLGPLARRAGAWLVYPMDDDVAVKDYSGNARHATTVTAVTVSPGAMGPPARIAGWGSRAA